MPTRAEVYAAIDTERAYQDKGKGNARTDRPNNSVGEELLLAHGYLSKAIQEWCGPHPEGRDASLHTIRKVAGIAVRALENNGAPPRD